LPILLFKMSFWGFEWEGLTFRDIVRRSRVAKNGQSPKCPLLLI
jgi:hypothetical protein